MQFSKIRNRQPVMTAHDMFSDKIVQVFAKTTGEYLGYVYLGQDPETLQEQIEAIKPDMKPARIPQLKLF